MKSSILVGFVEHTRHKPVKHYFKFPVYLYCFNIDELETLDKNLPLFGYNRGRPVSLYDINYLDKGEGTIREKLTRFLEEEGISEAISKIILITSGKYFGYAFNPVSFYYCFSDSGQLISLVAEVNNTYGEKHLYILKCRDEVCSEYPAEFNAPKEFHVSPFNNMEGHYNFSFSELGEKIDISIKLNRNGGPPFVARLWGQTVPLNSKNQLKTILKHPLIPLMTMKRIIIEAFRLHFIKKLPMFDKPVPKSSMTIGKKSPGIMERVCIKLTIRLLDSINDGQVQVRFPDGREVLYGNPESELKSDLTIFDYSFFSRAIYGGDIGFGETYMEGLWSSNDLTSLVRIILNNLKMDTRSGNQIGRILRNLLSVINRKTKNNIKGSRENISKHYDLSNSFFEHFLDSTMTYSSAVFTSTEEKLERAQKNKLQRLIKKAEIKSSDHVLEIGCGWGAFAIEAAKTTGCRVTGVTVSKKQYDYATMRIKKEGLQDRIRVLLEDYRKVKGQFNKIVSIEMLEAVGHEYLGVFFKNCSRLLRENGILVLQVITIPDQEYNFYRKREDWIQRHVFPGGHLPSLNAISNAITKYTDFIIEHLENIGPHYAITIREWKKKFLENWDVISEEGFDEVFKRKWIFYLSICEAQFRERNLENLQIVLTRPNNSNLSFIPNYDDNK